MVPERTPLDGLARLRCQVRLLQFTARMTCQLHDFSEFTLSILPPGFLKQSLSRRQMVRGVNVVRGMKELSERRIITQMPYVTGPFECVVGHLLPQRWGQMP